MDCNEVLGQLSDYLDDDARAELCRAIEEHLARCHDCKVEVDTVRKTIMLYQKGEQTEIPVRVSAELESVMAREYGRRRSEPAAD
ncbi:MAG TPA: zf-HC2 domain-containing protein [Candidatus Eisenbacteria bacterium]